MVTGAGSGCGRRVGLWTASPDRQFAALDPLPDDVDAAGAGDDGLDDELSFEVEVEVELSDDDEPEEAVSDAEADLRLSVR